jgi:hypothetical protein
MQFPWIWNLLIYFCKIDQSLDISHQIFALFVLNWIFFSCFQQEIKQFSYSDLIQFTTRLHSISLNMPLTPLYLPARTKPLTLAAKFLPFVLNWIYFSCFHLEIKQITFLALIQYNISLNMQLTNFISGSQNQTLVAKYLPI